MFYIHYFDDKNPFRYFRMFLSIIFERNIVNDKYKQMLLWALYVVVFNQYNDFKNNLFTFE